MLCLTQLVYCLLLKSLWSLEGMVRASGFPAASLLSGCVLLYSPLAAGALLGGMLLSSHILWLQGFIHSLGFHHRVCVVTPRPPVLCLILQPGCQHRLVITCISERLTVQGLNIPPFLLSAPFLPSSETILSGGEG